MCIFMYLFFFNFSLQIGVDFLTIFPRSLKVKLEQLGFAREPVEYSHRVLKLCRELLGTSHDMQIVDNGAPAQIEEILAQSTIPSTSSLPPTHTSQRMLDGHPFAQFGPSLRCLLALS